MYPGEHWAFGYISGGDFFTDAGNFQNLRGFPKRKENFILAELRAFRMKPLLLADMIMVKIEGRQIPS